ncbi:hypothetical protein [Cellulomonas fimi]|uniref:GPI inositol-deacylase PGAP1-like alpha/beta domain-containing protein n=1 Tax=Cellulomonas fimi TaxID=1708 RepID=A0A7Y0QGD9_CELFI|nr:hypothetical protein [Cellulomonas fimi]NMR20026.1 hypothetical protein [Cellulomonas fimi]
MTADDGPVLQPADALPRGLTVSGGAGAAFADLDELRGAAGALLAAAGHLDDAAADARTARAVVDGGGVESPSTAGSARAELDALITGPLGLVARAEHLRDLARSLQAAAALYGEAESWAERLVRAQLAVTGNVLGGSPVLAMLGGLVGGVLVVGVGARVAALLVGARRVLGDRVPTLQQAAMALPLENATLLLAATVRSLAPGRQAPSGSPVPDAARGLHVLDGVVVEGLLQGRLPVLGRRPLEVTPRLGATRTGPPPADAEAVLSGIGALYPASGGTPGTVAVTQLDHPDGSRGWLVSIPGTQADDLAYGSNPMRMDTNLRLVAGLPDDSTALVTEALARSGAEPDEPVLLAGHSQGGIAALALAGDPAFRARFRVTTVLTAGSPVATTPAASGVQVLSLQHRGDGVTATDGLPSPASPHHTVVERDLSESLDPADRLAGLSFGGAHGIDAYARTAGLASEAGAPSVETWERAAAAVLGGPGTVATHREFTGVVLPPGKDTPVGTTRPLSACGSPP